MDDSREWEILHGTCPDENAASDLPFFNQLMTMLFIRRLRENTKLLKEITRDFLLRFYNHAIAELMAGRLLQLPPK